MSELKAFINSYWSTKTKHLSLLMGSYCTIKSKKLEIIKKLKFTKEVGIIIKSKETSSKLAI